MKASDRDSASVVGDAIGAIAVFALSLGASAIRSAEDPPGLSLVPVVASAVACLALVFRGRWPIAVFAIAIAAWLLASVAGHSLPGSLAVAVALYTVALTTGRPGAFITWAVATAVAGVAGASFGNQPMSPVAAVPYLLLAGSTFGAVVLYGLYRSSHRAYVAALEARTSQLEREQELIASEASAVERARISRELHDVVAHHVSVMVIQAGAAEAVLADDPAAARTALESIRTTGREALGELRRMVGALREDGPDDPVVLRTPEPGLDAIDGLVQRLREAGLRIDLTRTGDPGPIPTSLDVSAYRIVQEALTNTLRHAGRGAHAQVDIRSTATELIVVISDDGRGVGATGAPSPPTIGRAGHGLIGMRERAALFGGDLTAGPDPAGGFRVVARLPRPIPDSPVDEPRQSEPARSTLRAASDR